MSMSLNRVFLLAPALVAQALGAGPALGQDHFVRGFNDALYTTHFDDPKVVQDTAVGCQWEWTLDAGHQPQWFSQGPGLSETLHLYSGHQNDRMHGYAQILLGYRAQDSLLGSDESADDGKITNLVCTLKRIDATECESNIEITAQPQFLLRVAVENDATLASEYANVSGRQGVDAPDINGFSSYAEGALNVTDLGSNGFGTITLPEGTGIGKTSFTLPSTASVVRVEAFVSEVLAEERNDISVAQVFYTSATTFSYLADGWVSGGLLFDVSQVEGHHYGSLNRTIVTGECEPPKDQDELSCAGFFVVRGGFDTP